jgi:hypothetical protein
MKNAGFVFQSLKTAIWEGILENFHPIRITKKWFSNILFLSESMLTGISTEFQWECFEN